jgi:N-acetylmuramoyl-L-alanine amidase
MKISLPHLERPVASCRVHAVAALLAATLAGCAAGPYRLDTTHTAAAQASRVQTLVLHYTAEDEPASLRVLTTTAVSSHYLVGGGAHPVVYRLVDESRSAQHAGLSEWQGRTFLNASSIGIEIVNAGWHDTPAGRGWAPYPPAQVDAVVALVKDIVRRHHIAPSRVVGHSDIAPSRKQDPGPLFPWARLAAEGLVTWPDAQVAARVRPGFEAQLPPLAWFQQRLAQVGYAVPQDGQGEADTRLVLQAFQMKYRPADIGGQADAETAALLEALTCEGCSTLRTAPPDGED